MIFLFGNPCPRRGEAFQLWEFVPTPWGSFPALGIRAHAVGKLSSFGISCPRRGEAFQLWESVPTPCAHSVGKLSSFGNSCPRRGEAFQLWEYVPTPWGSFPALGIRAHAVGKLSSFGIFSRSRDDVHIVSTFIAVLRQPVQADCPCRLVARNGKCRRCRCFRSTS